MATVTGQTQTGALFELAEQERSGYRAVLRRAPQSGRAGGWTTRDRSLLPDRRRGGATDRPLGAEDRFVANAIMSPTTSN
jgi:hypothetical protein